MSPYESAIALRLKGLGRLAVFRVHPNSDRFAGVCIRKVETDTAPQLSLIDRPTPASYERLRALQS